MTKIDEIKQKTKELLKYSYAYYVEDNPLISDIEYDKMFDELKALEDNNNFWLSNSPTRKVQGEVLECFTKIEHSKPMLSATKTKSIEDIKKFVDNNDFYCSYKLDGLTLVVCYKDGKFQQAITRGNGTIGEDVTAQAKMISNLPMTIPYKDYLELRGECVISWDNFNKINDTLEESYSHPRNLASGSLRQLDTNITKERNLSYVVFECVSDTTSIDGLMGLKEMELRWLDMLGFETVKRCFGTVDNCVEKMHPENYQYPVDGLIFEYNNKEYSKSLGATSHHESCRMALKWTDEVYETELKQIDWQPSRTGLITPVAIFKPVDLGGAITTKASLHNISIIEKLELGIGDRISVYRANMVIPQLYDNLTRSNSFEIPAFCPNCGEKTSIHNENGSKTLHCKNPECPSKVLKRLVHFVSKECINIEGLSEATLEALRGEGLITNYKDIYYLKNHIDKITLLSGFGAKKCSNLLYNIDKSRATTLDKFINSVGIPNIGKVASKQLAEFYNYDAKVFYEKGVSLLEDYTQIKDFGEVAQNSLINFFKKEKEELDMYYLMNEFYFTKPKKVEIHSNNIFTNKTFCITGSFECGKRSELQHKIEQLGGIFVSGVSKNTDILVTGEKCGSKLDKAKQLGTKIVREDELKMILEVE